jgi:hypothetical protein
MMILSGLRWSIAACESCDDSVKRFWEAEGEAMLTQRKRCIQ